MIKKVKIKKDAYNKLLELARKYAPRIVCGFLVGEKDDRNEIIQITDVREIKTRCGQRIHFQPVFTDFRRVADEIHKEGNVEPTGRDLKIMRWLKNGFWIIASVDNISAIVFDTEEFKVNVEKSRH